MAQVYAFRARVETLDFGTMAYHVVYLPAKIRNVLPLDKSPRLRTVGFVNRQPFRLALMPTAGKKWYLLLSLKFLKKCGAKNGDRVDVEFSLDDPDAVEVPPELRHAVEANGRAAQRRDPRRDRQHCRAERAVLVSAGRANAARPAHDGRYRRPQDLHQAG